MSRLASHSARADAPIISPPAPLPPRNPFRMQPAAVKLSLPLRARISSALKRVHSDATRPSFHALTTELENSDPHARVSSPFVKRAEEWPIERCLLLQCGANVFESSKHGSALIALFPCKRIFPISLVWLRRRWYDIRGVVLGNLC